ncbi:ras-related protein Rab-13-like [Physella acuta]|uniref:ras-related protein Rab-13-like n=1 Tax=Physella acuta TaxID=109671 RepID=UPI0027DE35D2|nr:ras-related protein Rab-13-like [Physella acuta]
MAKRYDTLLRLMLVGDTGVGKTCLINQYAFNEFLENHTTTVGVDFRMKVINLDGKNVKLQIWDTAGQERFEAITKQYYSRAQGCILVYDICSRSSFESLAKWLIYVKQYAKDSTSVVVVGNKSDLSMKRQVPTATAKQFADENNIRFYETSAKDALSLIKPFEDICRDILRAGNEPPLSPAITTSKIDLTASVNNSQEKRDPARQTKCC